MAARNVFAEDPTAGLGTIAERAGVHRATVYRHFPTRDALITGLYEAYLADVSAAIHEVDVDADDLLGEFTAVTRRVYERNVSWRAFAWAPNYSSAQRARQPDIVSILSTLVAALQLQGRLRDDLGVEELLVSWGAPVHFLSARIAAGDMTVDEVVAHMLRLLSPA